MGDRELHTDKLVANNIYHTASASVYSTEMERFESEENEIGKGIALMNGLLDENPSS